MDLLIQAVLQGVIIGSSYAVVALGATIIYNVTRVLNFAHGDLMTAALYLLFTLSVAFGLDPYVSMFVVFPVMFLLGLLLYRFVISRVINSNVLMVAQLTLGILFIIQSGLLIIYGGEFKRIPAGAADVLVDLPGGFSIRLANIFTVVAAAALVALLFWWLHRTEHGRSVRAINEDAYAAALMGCNVGRTRMIVFGLGVGVLAIAAGLLAPLITIHPSMGLRYTVITFVIMVLGTMGNFVGALIGALIVGIAESLGAVYISGTLSFILPYCIFVLVLLFRPSGLFAGRMA